MKLKIVAVFFCEFSFPSFCKLRETSIDPIDGTATEATMMILVCVDVKNSAPNDVNFNLISRWLQCSAMINEEYHYQLADLISIPVGGYGRDF